eukprot:TRINITY_DN8099_c0_g1_i2.p1 TRINITY_DN8099_c0_g1~~TRINITY_DN8099_c0_g1_i2.p1  ORF type:complete len:121 (-),score=11.51 TRINITY_DN8099_c0_g1_i2:225-587(-)
MIRSKHYDAGTKCTCLENSYKSIIITRTNNNQKKLNGVCVFENVLSFGVASENVVWNFKGKLCDFHIKGPSLGVKQPARNKCESTHNGTRGRRQRRTTFINKFLTVWKQQWKLQPKESEN